MRPRHYAGESSAPGAYPHAAPTGFNEAPALRRGKWLAGTVRSVFSDELQ